MTVRVQQHIVRLDIPVHNALLMDVAHGASKLSHPKSHCLLCECLPRNVESQVTAVHEIDYDVSASHQPRQDIWSSSLHVQIFNVLEAVTQVTEERVVKMLEHSSLSDNISNTL